MFDKELYWRNREARVRGQGIIEKASLQANPGQHAVIVPGKGLQLINRKNARRRNIDRAYTKRGFKGHVQSAHILVPEYPSHIGNRARMSIRRAARLKKARTVQ